jgi:adenylate cyclase
MNQLPLERRLEGTPGARFLQELFGNSACFPIANILLEMLLEGPRHYLGVPDLYTLMLASVTQAYFLSSWENTSRPRRFFGNLIGPALYTAIEFSIEGARFFAAPHHLAYWGFAAAIGAMQALRPGVPHSLQALVRVLEDVTRASILLAMYFVFENAAGGAAAGENFFDDRSHQFVALATLLLGVSIGLSSLSTQRYVALLRETAAQLRTYSEWLLGRDLLEKSISNPDALTLARQRRAVLFMDIRNFTRWSKQRPPEAVADMLNRYYHAAETALASIVAIKIKYAADEVMAVFPDAVSGVSAARNLRAEIGRLLAEEGLGAGIAVHAGPLVEGLLGNRGVRFYDVIGDTVNTAKRIESIAVAGEILVSREIRDELGNSARFAASRQVSVKGKTAPLDVYPLME